MRNPARLVVYAILAAVEFLFISFPIPLRIFACILLQTSLTSSPFESEQTEKELYCHCPRCKTEQCVTVAILSFVALRFTVGQASHEVYHPFCGKCLSQAECIEIVYFE